MGQSIYQRIYNTVRQIPAGQVATYGQIAAMLTKCTPRMVGYALHALPHNSDVPWHRVINAQGKISLRAGSDSHILQMELLKNEGISFDQKNAIDLQQYQWQTVPK